MFPTMIPMAVRLEQEQRKRSLTFPPMNEHIRAELEARQFEEAESLPRPARSFSLRSLWRRPALLRMQHHLK